MVARSKKDIEKAHALNKKVRREKARLRKRGPKKHSRYEKMVTEHITLAPEVLAKVNEEAKRRGVSPQRVVKEAIGKMMKADWEKLNNGVQEKSDIKVDENTKQ